jgi:hypothetical protein
MNSLNSIVSSTQQFVASPDPVYLAQANDYADGLLSQVVTLAPRLGADEAQDYQAAITSFRRSAGQHLRNLENDVAEAKRRVGELETALAEQQAKIDGQDARLDSVVTDYQAQFSEAQSQRQTEFSTALEEARDRLRAAVDGAEQRANASLSATTSQLDERYEQIATSSEEKMRELDELLEKAVKTVGVIGGTGMAGGYKLAANSEKKAADFWRWVTIAALLGAIAASVFAVAHGIVHGFKVDTFFAKWAIVVPFAALAGYAARESSRHRDQTRINRQIELQLASLDSYLVTLPEDEQHRVRVKLADRFFGELYPTLGDGSVAED